MIQFYFKALGEKKWHYCHGVWVRPLRTFVTYWDKDELTGHTVEVTREVLDGENDGDKMKVKEVNRNPSGKAKGRSK